MELVIGVGGGEGLVETGLLGGAPFDYSFIH